METYQHAEALDALGDPTRRAILEQLRGGPKPVVELARVLPVTRPAVSQHLRVLKSAGLVIDRPQGSRRLYGVDPRGLEALRVYLEGLWGEALANYRRAADGPSQQPTREGEG